MSKAARSKTNEHDGKSFLNLAGEAFVVLGEDIVEGKHKVVEVVGEKFAAVKSAISNLTHRKKAPKKAAKKKTASKAVVKKTVKKAAKKVAGKKTGSNKKVGNS
ncbi:MAG TPA: hypothetical protein VGN00_22125 [Puia sp.]|jgi:hypothetical protein